MYSRIALLSLNLLQNNLNEAFDDLSAIETFYNNYKKQTLQGLKHLIMPDIMGIHLMYYQHITKNKMM